MNSIWIYTVFYKKQWLVFSTKYFDDSPNGGNFNGLELSSSIISVLRFFDGYPFDSAAVQTFSDFQKYIVLIEPNLNYICIM